MTRRGLLLIVLLAGCHPGVEAVDPKVSEPAGRAAAQTQESAPDAAIRTDRSTYVLVDGPQGPEATIVATLTAPADQTLYIVNCNGASSVTLQRKIDDEWVFAWVISMNACLSPPIVVPPAGEHTARIYLHERSGGVVEPPGARIIESGTYRVVWTGVLTSYDPQQPGFGVELPLEQRVSRPVTITRGN